MHLFIICVFASVHSYTVYGFLLSNSVDVSVFLFICLTLYVSDFLEIVYHTIISHCKVYV